jgi:hypothetical protein
MQDSRRVGIATPCARTHGSRGYSGSAGGAGAPAARRARSLASRVSIGRERTPSSSARLVSRVTWGSTLHARVRGSCDVRARARARHPCNIRDPGAGLVIGQNEIGEISVFGEAQQKSTAEAPSCIARDGTSMAVHTARTKNIIFQFFDLKLQ